MRERLIDLIIKADEDALRKRAQEKVESNRDLYGFIADYLLDKGVIVLPCKPEEVVYAAHKDCRTVRVAYASVEHILADLEAGWCIGYTKEEAEEALKRLQSNE